MSTPRTFEIVGVSTTETRLLVVLKDGTVFIRDLPFKQEWKEALPVPGSPRDEEKKKLRDQGGDATSWQMET